MPIRVVQSATGQTGVHALRAILDHPDLELVGLVVHSEAKAGRDAGELCGRPPVGVLATSERQAALAAEPDCVAVFESWADGARKPQLLDDAEEMLRAGANVVSVSLPSFVYPRSPANDPADVDRLEEACQAGSTSFFVTGIDPGYTTDVLPLVLSGVSGRIDQVRITEIYDYSTYDDPSGLFKHHGFGAPLSTIPPYLSPNGGFVPIRTGLLALLADGLGIDVDEYRFQYERAPAPATYRFDAGTIEQGTAAGHRLELHGIVEGRAVLVAEHVTRMHPDVAPNWPQPVGRGSYRIVIQGFPRYQLDFALSDDRGDPMVAGCALTALRAVNAIPAVVAAPAGVLSALDLPLVTGRGRAVRSRLSAGSAGYPPVGSA
jgi:4-hydroxy-tetrahydrodipicolinate reductase